MITQNLPILSLIIKTSAGEMSLTQAKTLLKNQKHHLTESLVDLREQWQDFEKTHATNLQARHAFLELAVDASLLADSPLGLLDFGIQLGRLLVTEMNQYQRGVELMNQAFHQLHVLNFNNYEKALVVMELAEVYLQYHDKLESGYLDAAIQMFETVIQLGPELEEKQILGRAYIGLGSAQATGQRVMADRVIKYCKEGLRYLSPEESPIHFGQAHYRLGVAYHNRPGSEEAEDLRKARGHLQKTLEYWTEELNPLGFRAACGKLSLIYEELGQHRLAIEYQERIVASLDPISNRREYAHAQLSLGRRCRNAADRVTGRSYLDQKYYVAQALACYTICRESFHKDVDPMDWASATDGLAIIFFKYRQNAQKALALMEEALGVLDEIKHAIKYNLISSDYALLCCGYADMLDQEGNPPLAESFLNRAESIAKRLISKGERTSLWSNRIMAMVLATRADHCREVKTRKKLFKRTASFTKKFLKAHPNEKNADVIGLFQKIHTHALVEMGQLERARQTMEAERVSSEKMLPDDASIVDLIGMFANQSEWDDLIDVCLKGNDQESALCYSDNARARVLNKITRSDNVNAKTILPPDIEKKYRKLSAEWFQIHKTAGSNPNSYTRLRQIIVDLEETVQSVQRWRGHWALNADAEKWSIDLHDDLVFTDCRTAIVEYWCYENRAEAFVLMPDNYRQLIVQKLPHGHALELTDWIHTWYRHYDSIKYEGFRAIESWLPVLEDMCRWIGDAYWKPLIKLFEGQAIERVIVIPDHLMHLLPIHIGDLGMKGSPKYVSDRYEISFAHSLNLLRRAHKREGPACPPILFAGNPIEKCPLGSDCIRCHLPLPQTEKQVETLHTRWPETHCLLGADCSAEKILQAAKEISPGIVHFATHGKTFFQDPLSSGLLVHLEDDSWQDPFSVFVDHDINLCWVDSAVGNILNLDSIIRCMKLDNCRLVVLSACEVGIGQLYTFRESISVASGFLSAGVPSVIAPQWPVSEISTQLFVGKLYEFLQQEPGQKARALKKAQYWLRNLPVAEARELVSDRNLAGPIRLSGEPYPFSHIFFWAPFILIGSPR